MSALTEFLTAKSAVSEAKSAADLAAVAANEAADELDRLRAVANEAANSLSQAKVAAQYDQKLSPLRDIERTLLARLRQGETLTDEEDAELDALLEALGSDSLQGSLLDPRR